MNRTSLHPPRGTIKEVGITPGKALQKTRTMEVRPKVDTTAGEGLDPAGSQNLDGAKQDPTGSQRKQQGAGKASGHNYHQPTQPRLSRSTAAPSPTF